jgi:hypothetical protein
MAIEDSADRLEDTADIEEDTDTCSELGICERLLLYVTSRFLLGF